MLHPEFFTPPQEDGRHLYVQYENLPVELVAYPQWVCWRYVDRGEGRKPDKQPVNPHTLGNAGVHWTNTWNSFEQAYTVYLMHHGRGLHGIGFVLTADDPFVGVDIDHCLAGQDISPYARDVLCHLQSYAEVSPSGRGLRILVACPEHTENARTEAIEVYAHSRFLTLTGHHVIGTPATISRVQKEQIELLLPRREDAQATATTHQVDVYISPTGDLDLWQRIFEHDRFGGHHLRRFQGDTSLDRGDHSLTVIRLVNCLARWTGGDPVRMRSMMLLSPLANEKWLSKRGKGDWLDHQIADAIRYIGRGA